MQPVPHQQTFDELGRPLRDVTFVVVDLETTGSSPHEAAITEIGAVKVRGGEVLGTFATLVNPTVAIPPFIAVLTGITDSMVARAPALSSALPAFLEFARGSVLVAHNAPFDLGFLRAACERTGQPWPGFESLDTARLARRVLTRDETPNCKLSTLARLFRAEVTPCHRALADAQATVDVLHGLLARVGGLGVQSLEEVHTFSGQISPQQRRKRHLAEALPSRPGVYMFRDGQGRALYIGKSKDIRSRVRSYFTASEPRTRMAEMLSIAESVQPVPCAHNLEAEVRELRLIAEHKPRYNRRSRFPERSVYLKLTVEPFPRLSQVRAVRDDGATYLGPFSATSQAELATAALHEAFQLRQCTSRLSLSRPTAACVLADLGRCGAPCDGRQSQDDYADIVAAVREAITNDPGELVGKLLRRINRLAGAERFEEAAAARNRLAACLHAASRLQRLTALSRCSKLIAAQHRKDGGWDISVARYGRLAAADVAASAAEVRPLVAALAATAETVVPGVGPAPAASAEEMECVLRWLETPGTRLVELDGEWCSPAFGATGHARRLDLHAAAKANSRPLDDRRGLRPLHQPPRVWEHRPATVTEARLGTRPVSPAVNRG